MLVDRDGDAMGGSSELGVAHATGHQIQHGLALQDGGSEGNPFHLPWMVEADGGLRVTSRWLG
jgi:hypothetical protein